MIRRNVLQTERDPRAVKWSLIAAAFALSLGCYAEMVMTAEVETADPTVLVGDAAGQDLPKVTVSG